MKFGILGGTFDPIHNGHLTAAAAARRALSLDRILLMPSRMPPHRSAEPRASIYHRFAMAALAAAEYDLVISELELQREGPSYTAKTLDALHAEGYQPSQLYFITGSDAFAEVETWFDYPRLFTLANFVVVSRPGAPRVADLVLASRAAMQSGGDMHPPELAILPVDASTVDVSSTDIRRRVAVGDSIDGLVPAGVASHIRRHGLYVPEPVAAVL